MNMNGKNNTYYGGNNDKRIKQGHYGGEYNKRLKQGHYSGVL